MACEFTESVTEVLAVGLFCAVSAFAWSMWLVKRLLREAHPAQWGQMDDAVLPLRRRIVNSARLFGFVLAGRYRDLGDRRLDRAATWSRLLLLCLLVSGFFAAYCR